MKKIKKYKFKFKKIYIKKERRKKPRDTSERVN